MNVQPYLFFEGPHRGGDGGTVTMPLSATFWSPCFGMLTDRFGVGWMISVESKEASA